MEDTGEVEGGTHEAKTPAERYRTQHDWEGGHSMCTSVVEAVSAVTGDAPATIDPLYDVVDPDALDELLASVRGDERATVTFSFHGCDVTVTGRGTIVVEPPETGRF